MEDLPVRSVSRRRSRSSAASAELETLRALMPRAEGEGRRVVLLSAASRARARAAWCASSRPRRRADGARSSSTAPATRSCGRRTGRSSRRSTSSPRVIEPDELRAALAAGGGELTRLLPDLPARIGELPRAGRGRPGHRAPPAAHRGRRPARRRQPQPARPAGARGRALGRCPTLLLLRHLARAGRRRAPAAARHLPRHRGRRAARRSPRPSPTCAAPRTSCGCGWPGSRGEEVDRVRPRAPRAASPTRSVAELARAIRELTDGNAVPGLRAVARAGRDRRRRDRGRRRSG